VAYEDHYERRNLANEALKQAGRKAFAALTAALEKEANYDLAYLLVRLDDPSSYALIRKHFDAKRFVGHEHDFTWYLGKHGVDPIQEKQSRCTHRWRRANITDERMDICDGCGLFWYYFDGRGDAIPDADVSRPVAGLTKPSGKSAASLCEQKFEIIEAAEQGDLAKVRALLAEGANPDTRHREWGFTALHSAAGTGNVELVELLLENGANVNTPDVTGATPLHEAAKRGHLKAAELLLAHGADVNRQTSTDRMTPLQMVEELNPNEALAVLLQRHGAK
jgi:hypothetical protein